MQKKKHSGKEKKKKRRKIYCWDHPGQEMHWDGKKYVCPRCKAEGKY